MPNDPFVDIAALPLLGPVHYLDARDRAMFDAGHAPGAVRVPVEEWDAAARAAETGFNKTAYWDDALGSLGVDHSALSQQRSRAGAARRLGVAAWLCSAIAVIASRPRSYSTRSGSISASP
jgi:hypothetical protein